MRWLGYCYMSRKVLIIKALVYQRPPPDWYLAMEVIWISCSSSSLRPRSSRSCVRSSVSASHLLFVQPGAGSSFLPSFRTRPDLNENPIGPAPCFLSLDVSSPVSPPVRYQSANVVRVFLAFPCLFSHTVPSGYRLSFPSLYILFPSFLLRAGLLGGSSYYSSPRRSPKGNALFGYHVSLPLSLLEAFSISTVALRQSPHLPL